MQKLGKPQIIALCTIALILGYFLMPIIFFATQKAIKVLPKFYSPSLPIEIITDGSNKVQKQGLLSLLLAYIFSFGLVFLVPFIPKKQSLHGNAKFAGLSEMRSIGLLGEQGIIVGRIKPFLGKPQFLRFAGERFMSLAASTRGGKGVSIVIPNLMDWKYSIVVNDPKQEGFNFTSKYRKEKLGQEVYLFNPFGKKTHRYNPLYYVDMRGDRSFEDLRTLAGALYPIVGDGLEKFFAGKAQFLFMGMCYLADDLMNTRTGIEFLDKFHLKVSFDLGGILDLSDGFSLVFQKTMEVPKDVNNPSLGVVEVPAIDETTGMLVPPKRIEGFEDTWELLKAMDDELREKNTGETFLSARTIKFIQRYVNVASENTKAGILSSFNGPLEMFGEGNLRLATSGNDFDLRDLRKKKMTIYIGITADNIDSAKPILNLFWQQLIALNTKELPEFHPELKYQVLLLQDEFTAAGYIHKYLEGIAYIAGFGFRSIMVYQTDSQLQAPIPNGYGQYGASTLLANHACKIFFTPENKDDAKKLSESLGNRTVKTRSRSYGKNAGSGSESESPRALMLQQELTKLPFEDEIILLPRSNPIKCKKAFYYDDPYFVNKFKEVSPLLSKIKGMPEKGDFTKANQNFEMAIKIPEQSFERMQAELVESMNNNIRYARARAQREIELQRDTKFFSASSMSGYCEDKEELENESLSNDEIEKLKAIGALNERNTEFEVNENEFEGVSPETYHDATAIERIRNE